MITNDRQALNKLSLNALFFAYGQGVPGAEEAFLECIYTEVLSVVRRHLGRRRQYLSESDRADVVQDVLVEFWRYDLERFDESQGTLMAFVASRVRWRLSDAVARLTRDLDRYEGLEASVDVENPDLCPHLLLEEAAYERRLRLLPVVARQSLEKLDDAPACEAVKIHDFDGRSLRALARRRRQHPSTLSRARQRGLAHLREDAELHRLLAA